jgi:hypothetical protein
MLSNVASLATPLATFWTAPNNAPHFTEIIESVMGALREINLLFSPEQPMDKTFDLLDAH